MLRDGDRVVMESNSDKRGTIAGMCPLFWVVWDDASRPMTPTNEHGFLLGGAGAVVRRLEPEVEPFNPRWW